MSNFWSYMEKVELSNESYTTAIRSLIKGYKKERTSADLQDDTEAYQSSTDEAEGAFKIWRIIQSGQGKDPLKLAYKTFKQTDTQAQDEDEDSLKNEARGMYKAIKKLLEESYKALNEALSKEKDEHVKNGMSLVLREVKLAKRDIEDGNEVSLAKISSPSIPPLKGAKEMTSKVQLGIKEAIKIVKIAFNKTK